MTKSRKMIFDPNFETMPAKEGDEVFRNGIFHFNISRLSEDIENGKIRVVEETINVEEWFKWRFRSSNINEEHLLTVDFAKPVLKGEISPGMYNIIDGNHRMEKAYREKHAEVNSYKVYSEDLRRYFTDMRSYEAYVGYWNSKL